MRKEVIVVGILMMFSLFLIGNVMAIPDMSTPSVCCEKTISGAMCVNTNEASCDASESIVPTSCDTTSFCKLGTCYNSREGICLENTPQVVCQANGGIWSEKKANEIAQCKLGCCLLSDQAAFVTMTRCKSLSTFYGVSIDFKTTITSEQTCIAAANAQDVGACVSIQGGEKTCIFTTRKACGGTSSTATDLNDSEISNTNVKSFYKDLLCSNEELAVPNNARQASTGCYQGKVYWYDSAGNRENVYSSNSNVSWNNGVVADPDEICSPVGDSKTCGNCDYLLGSRCSTWDSVFFNIGKPANVNNYCKTTKCTDREGNIRMNGESWCVYDSEIGTGSSLVGSRHYREICADGKVQVEACEDYRNQICEHSGIQTTGGEYSVAACRVNRWQDCTAQNNKDDCENTDQRDCLWAESVDGISLGNPTYPVGSSAFSNPTGQAFSNPSASGSGNTVGQGLQAVSSVAGAASAFTGSVIQQAVGAGVGQWEQNSISNEFGVVRSGNDTGICVPMVPPGLDFWKTGSAQATCSQASANCMVNVEKTYKKNILTGKEEVDEVNVRPNECLTMLSNDGSAFEIRPDWAAKVNSVCAAMGDCGSQANINGVFTNEGYEWKYKNQSYYFTEADLGLLAQPLSPGTGQAIAIDYIINDQYKLNDGDYVYVKA
jgi:hypothetical protein